MFFKKLEISGFKSFAQKANVEFHPGVTAIVGPNGCGKSNISDSIKWVLGEQSAKSLRGHRMEDIIFNGTATHDPVNFAEVSITFDNEGRGLPIDFNEVVISRRLYRSGESEYLINKNPVRLKDIQSMLAGTGLGVGNYSVIEQGRIDQILNAKPEDRRALFEEAAGITRFKAKKKETLRNLEATEQNLQRISDIITELKRQISSLERQAKKAEKFKKEYDIVKKYDITQSVNQRESLLQQKKQKESGGDSPQESETEIVQRLSSISATLDEAKRALEVVEQQHSDAKSRQLVVENQIRNSEEKKLIFRKYIEEVDENIKNLDAAITASQIRSESLAKDINESSTNRDQVEAEKISGENDFKAKDDARIAIGEKITELAKDISVAAREKEVIQNEIAASQKKVIQVSSEAGQAKKELDRLNVQANEINESILVREGLLAQDQTLESTANAELRKKIQDRERLESEIKNEQVSLQRMDQMMRQAANDHASLQSKIQVLEELTKKHQGFSQGIRFLIDEAQRDSQLAEGFMGLLADLVEVDRGYELALEVALETYAQALICRGEKDYLNASIKLRDAKRGPAILLRLDAIRNPGVIQQDPIMFEPGVEQLSQHTRVGDQVSQLYQTIIHNIYVVGSVAQGLDLSSRYPNHVFVTKGGDLFKGCLSVTGADEVSEESLLFGRENRIKELKASLIELELENDRLSRQHVAAMNHIANLQSSFKSLSESIPTLQVKLADVKSSIQHHLSYLSDARERVSKIEHALIDLHSKVEEFKEVEGREKDLISQKSCRLDELDKQEVEIQTSLNSLRNDQEKSLIDVTEAKTRLATVTERYAQADQHYKRLLTARDAEQNLQSQSQADRSDSQKKLQETQSNLSDMEEALGQLNSEKDSLLVQFNEVTQERTSVQAKVREKEGIYEKARKDLEDFRNYQHKLELELQGLDHKLQQLQQRMLDQYQVDIEQPLPDELEIESFNLDEWDESKITQIKARLAKVGPVNLIAVEEYGDLQERFDFLDREREDLLQSKDDIQKALLKINRQTREMFISTFTQIQTYFVEYFKLLFGGGNAEILLMDQGDVLESGIEIVARPPGKKLQSITLMSGGEKALTAIALMFAVFRVKPSPFCVLDEIDAPLDDVNVQRFANVLQEFIKNSQFIIITHNKRTMAVADVLYGVTMQRSGMSQVVSVKFEDADQHLKPMPSPRAAVKESLPK